MLGWAKIFIAARPLPDIINEPRSLTDSHERPAEKSAKIWLKWRESKHSWPCIQTAVHCEEVELGSSIHRS